MNFQKYKQSKCMICGMKMEVPISSGRERVTCSRICSKRYLDIRTRVFENFQHKYRKIEERLKEIEKEVKNGQ